MCGPFLFGSFWWIVPLVGMLMCLGFLIVMSRAAGTGFTCMGGRRGEHRHQGADTRP